MPSLIRISSLLLALLAPAVGNAGAGEDASAVVERWSAAYTSNDPEAIAQVYASDAILLGTVSPVISVGTEAIRKYFSGVKGSGNRNALQERHTLVLGEDAVVVTGFYEFSRIQDGIPVPRPARFTMLVTKRGGDEW